MNRYLLALLISVQGAYAFWPFDWLSAKNDPLPAYAMEHPMMTEESVYGVGVGKSFLEAKTKALNDIATQLRSDVRSITSVEKNSGSDTTQTNQQITVLTQRAVDNYAIVDEAHANGQTYLLIRYKRSGKNPSF